MTKTKLVDKNLKLSSEFYSYITSNPKAMSNMPKSACIVFVSKFDKKLTKKNMKLAKDLKLKGKNCYVVKKMGEEDWSVKPFRD